MKRLICILFFATYFYVPSPAQDAVAGKNTDSLSAGTVVTKETPAFYDGIRVSHKRKWIVGAGLAAGYATILVSVNETWYKNFGKTPFHTFNDIKEWKQVDKLGHAWTAYNFGRSATELWRWAGMNKKNAVIAGGLSGISYLSIIEFLDAHSAAWGWSWGDVGANILGTSLFVTQEAAWGKQKISYKFSAHRTHYQPDLEARADDLYGKSFLVRSLKDYNAQTYWLSFNINSFIENSRLPNWFNIALGYGADGMFGGFKNVAYDKSGNLTFDRTDIKRVREWYLAPDIDFTKIKTAKKGVKILLLALNSIKVPSPSLRYSNGKWKASAFYF